MSPSNLLPPVLGFLVVACVLLWYHPRARPLAAECQPDRSPRISALRLSFEKESPVEWNWQLVTPPMIQQYSRRFGRTLAPGNYASRVVNQHSDQWCGCCYLVASLQMLQDRLHVALGMHTSSTMFPAIEFDRQLALDTYNAYKKPRINGDWNACQGGNPLDVLRSIHEKKCQVRVVSGNGGPWFGYPRSGDRRPPGTPEEHVVPLSEHNQLQNNVAYLKWRIFKYGPVVLGIHAQCMLHMKADGIIDTNVNGPRNHAICVIGWTHIDTQECWLARNSWGTTHVPREKPADMSCVTENKNTCSIAVQEWRGAAEHPGCLYIPTTYTGIQGVPSPWYDAIPVVLRKLLAEEACELHDTSAI